jgi:hypothetical protein
MQSVIVIFFRENALCNVCMSEQMRRFGNRQVSDIRSGVRWSNKALITDVSKYILLFIV